MATLIEIPTLGTERLVLRAFRAGDLDGLAAMNADPAVQRFLYNGRQITREMCADHDSAWPMEAARLRIVRGRGRSAVCRAGRRAASAGMAGAGTGLCAGCVVPRARIGRGSGHHRARSGVPTARFTRMAGFILPANAHSARVAEHLGAVKERTITLRGFVADCWVHRRTGAGAVV